MKKLSFCFLIAFLFIATGKGQADRAIPDDNLAYPVLVRLDNGSAGSGFFLNNNKNIFFVTAAHVLFDEKSGGIIAKRATLLSYSKNPKETEKNIIELDLSNLLAANKIRKHSTEDIAIVFIADVVTDNYKPSSFKIKFVSGVTSLERAPSGILCVDINGTKQFKDVLTANTIYLFGYPTSIGIKEIPQIDSLRPLLRFGIIAGTNPSNKTIILDCPSYPGNSGGPVLEVEELNFSNRRFNIIGVVSQFIPFAETWLNVTHKYQNLTISNSGYAVAVSMDPVLELINSQ